MTLFPIALGVAFLAFWISTIHLGTSIMAFYDFVALAMVVGGTAAVAMIVLPWSERKEVMRAFKTLFVGAPDYRKQTLNNGLAFIRNRQSGTEWANLPATSLANTLMNEGWELLTLGIQKDKLERILHERVYQAGKRSRKLANAVRSLSKYPPAFGLAGTVLGLMQLMKGISEGLNAKETGVQMAVALVATFYGLMVSNLLVNPAGEALLKTAVAEEEAADLAVQAIVLAAESTSLLEAQEILNSFVSDEQKVDMIGSFASEGDAA